MMRDLQALIEAAAASVGIFEDTVIRCAENGGVYVVPNPSKWYHRPGGGIYFKEGRGLIDVCIRTPLFHTWADIVRAIDGVVQFSNLEPSSNPMGPYTMDDLRKEMAHAYTTYPDKRLNAHEGLAYILEEVEELKAEVFKKPKEYDKKKQRQEALQIAVTALRFVDDLT